MDTGYIGRNGPFPSAIELEPDIIRDFQSLLECFHSEDEFELTSGIIKIADLLGSIPALIHSFGISIDSLRPLTYYAVYGQSEELYLSAANILLWLSDHVKNTGADFDLWVSPQVSVEGGLLNGLELEIPLTLAAVIIEILGNMASAKCAVVPMVRKLVLKKILDIFSFLDPQIALGREAPPVTSLKYSQQGTEINWSPLISPLVHFGCNFLRSSRNSYYRVRLELMSHIMNFVLANDNEEILDMCWNGLINAADNGFKNTFWKCFVSLGFIALFARFEEFSGHIQLLLAKILQNTTYYAGKGELAFLTEHRIPALIIQMTKSEEENLRVCAYRCIANMASAGGRYLYLWIDPPDLLPALSQLYDSASYVEKVAIIETIASLSLEHTILNVIEKVDVISITVPLLLARGGEILPCCIDLLNTALRALVEYSAEAAAEFCERLVSEGVLSVCDELIPKGSTVLQYAEMMALASELRSHVNVVYSLQMKVSS
jgi:hypothetical protein